MLSFSRMLLGFMQEVTGQGLWTALLEEVWPEEQTFMALQYLTSGAQPQMRADKTILPASIYYHHFCPCLSPHGTCGDGDFCVSSLARQELSTCSALAWGEEGWGCCRFSSSVWTGPSHSCSSLLFCKADFCSRLVSVMTLHLRCVKFLWAVWFQDPEEPH